MTSSTAIAALMLTAALPLWRAWDANRATTLRHALAWATAAWAAWIAALLAADLAPPWAATARYLALALTGCAGISVLGSRRPGAAAWHFVTLGLLVVLLLPVAEGWGHVRLSPPRTLFLAGTLAVAFLNYLPTRLGLAALVLAVACGLELLDLAAGDEGLPPGWLAAARFLLAVGPWVALAAVRRAPRPGSEFDRTWRSFRDRFGALWALRLRDLFNRAAANQGWTAHLAWHGLEPSRPADEGPMTDTLRALLKRFGTDVD